MRYIDLAAGVRISAIGFLISAVPISQHTSLIIFNIQAMTVLTVPVVYTTNTDPSTDCNGEWLPTQARKYDIQPAVHVWPPLTPQQSKSQDQLCRKLKKTQQKKKTAHILVEPLPHCVWMCGCVFM